MKPSRPKKPRMIVRDDIPTPGASRDITWDNWYDEVNAETPASSALDEEVSELEKSWTQSVKQKAEEKARIREQRRLERKEERRRIRLAQLEEKKTKAPQIRLVGRVPPGLYLEETLLSMLSLEDDQKKVSGTPMCSHPIDALDPLGGALESKHPLVRAWTCSEEKGGSTTAVLHGYDLEGLYDFLCVTPAIPPSLGQFSKEDEIQITCLTASVRNVDPSTIWSYDVRENEKKQRAKAVEDALQEQALESERERAQTAPAPPIPPTTYLPIGHFHTISVRTTSSVRQSEYDFQLQMALALDKSINMV